METTCKHRRTHNCLKCTRRFNRGEPIFFNFHLTKPRVQPNDCRMDWGLDVDVGAKKLIPRLGRRAGSNNVITEDARSDDDLLDSPAPLASGKSARPTAPVAPPRTRKTGWGDELKSGKTRTLNAFEQERFRVTETDEPDDEIPVIPDLDEIQEDSGLSDVAKAIKVGTNRVAAYKELDKDLLKNEAFVFLDDVNLCLLTDKLYPEKQIKETDDVWSWDLLFMQISTELNSEARKTAIL